MRPTVARTAVALLFVLSSAVAAPVPKVAKKRLPDPEAFVGTWETVVSEQNGQAMAKAIWTFDPDLTMWSKPPGDSGKGHKWPIKLDTDSSPKRIDIDRYPGIYEFDGDDIRVLFGYDGTRPTSLDVKDKFHYVVLRRVKEKEGGK